ncbi:GTP-binding protein Rhes-like [Protopterus annectens]|uniref:GTP-binding protein Rhes-like n=1 Tax=Protopterus annectens TaxID=7888 RepID=UPI001CF974CD|nr:GTP-binding protein Rhes-like [Protopterus annectens]
MSLSVKEKSHIRLMFLGAAGVGKTSLIRRFLLDTFETKYRRTVDELHIKEYNISGMKMQMDILDTSGSYDFPAMRKLSIKNSDAFALVYAVDDAVSFETVKSLRDEILEIKEDNKLIPVVVVGNKCDNKGELQVSSKDIVSTVEVEWNNKHIETSAKTNENVAEIFSELLQQANLPSRLSPALRRRETFPKDNRAKPPMNKTNSCTIS